MSNRIEQEPTLKAGHTHIDPNSKRYTHPAFGQIRASRISGSTRLYGSEDMRHGNYIRLTITRSELERNLSTDSHYPTKDLVELDLSEAQWATLISSVNVWDGTPCTIYRFNGETMPAIPFRSQRDEFEDEMLDKIRETTSKIDAAIADIEGEIGSSLSKTKREKVLNHLNNLRQEVSSNMPFLAKCFDEYTENKTERAKMEVHAYTQNTLNRIALQAMAAGADAKNAELAPANLKALPVHLDDPTGATPAD